MGMCQNNIKTGVEDPQSLVLQVNAKDSQKQINNNKADTGQINGEQEGNINKSSNQTNINQSNNVTENIDSKNKEITEDPPNNDNKVGKSQSEILMQEQGLNKDQEVNDFQIPLNSQFKSEKDVNTINHDESVKLEETPEVFSTDKNVSFMANTQEKNNINDKKSNRDLQVQIDKKEPHKGSFEFEGSSDEEKKIDKDEKTNGSPTKQKRPFVEAEELYVRNETEEAEPPSPDMVEKKWLREEDDWLDNGEHTNPPSPDIHEKNYIPGYENQNLIKELPKGTFKLKEIDSIHRITQEGDYTTGIKRQLEMDSKKQTFEEKQIDEVPVHETPVMKSKKSECEKDIKNNSSLCLSQTKKQQSPIQKGKANIDTDDEKEANSINENKSNIIKNSSKRIDEPVDNINFLTLENLETNEDKLENSGKKSVLVEKKADVLVEENVEKVKKDEKSEFQEEKVEITENKKEDAVPPKSNSEEDLKEEFDEMVEELNEDNTKNVSTIIGNESQTIGFSHGKVENYLQGHFDMAIDIDKAKNVTDPLEISIKDKNVNNIFDEPASSKDINQVQKNNDEDPERTFHSYPTNDQSNMIHANPIPENSEMNQEENLINISQEAIESTDRIRDLGSINESNNNLDKNDEKKSVSQEANKLVNQKKTNSQKEIDVDKKLDDEKDVCNETQG